MYIYQVIHEACKKCDHCNCKDICQHDDSYIE